ncbi:AGE family epimerase/isomerase [Pseudoalteromonas sp. OFAV1]|uniref:AGE family epimerase/isomerase n=1 Tax=Pseudoalteromonas sp. OFAV1 TaxID=2908892 RepID=UPI001F15EC3D|nr:AGE family epimerase/isomerase [Pseudoalteromonas sp. OFAV1]MCF2902591.1 AGE family epimerase/isomerase [Pseudoalteromonas sp. OFAV1]
MATVDFKSPVFLKQHIKDILAFYHPHCVDHAAHGLAGFYQYFKNDGAIYDKQTRHLVSSTRFVFNYAMAYIEFKEPEYLSLAKHGLAHLEHAHKQASGGYAWLIKQDESGAVTVLDDTNHCYGLAFVLLANAVALKAGISDCKNTISQVWDLLEQYYFEPQHNAYLDEQNADFSHADDYRGQNANMHLCEALLMCFEATNETRYLKRAKQLAETFTVKLAAHSQQFVWEHYNKNWQIDLDYNKDDPQHLFRPWGFQPGHQTEWAKLLLILHRHIDEPWLVTRAKSLFDETLSIAWDRQHGGIFYGFAPDKQICDSDKYFWVQAESLAAAALLADATNDESYWQWYEKIWLYSWQHMVDHQYGAWYRILSAQNQPYSDEKSPAGKTDYHTMGACYEVLRTLTLRNA